MSGFSVKKITLSTLITLMYSAGAVYAQTIVPPPVAPPGVAGNKDAVAAVAPPSVLNASAIGLKGGGSDGTPMPQVATGQSNLPTQAQSPSVTPQQAVVEGDLLTIALPELPPEPVKKPTKELKQDSKASKPPVAKKVASPVESDTLISLSDTPVTKEKSVDPFSGLLGMPVSDSQFNRLVFPEPVEGLYFPEGTPLPECAEKDQNAACRPIFLNGRHVVLLQLRAGAMGLHQMVVHLKSGRFLTLNLLPGRGPGAVIRIEGAEDGASDARIAETKISKNKPAGGMTAAEQDLAFLSRFAKGDIPQGYEPQALSAAVRYDLFDVIPLAVWGDNGTERVHLLRIKAHGDRPVAINPGLFRGPGTKALALDKDTITNTSTALLYIYESIPGVLK